MVEGLSYEGTLDNAVGSQTQDLWESGSRLGFTFHPWTAQTAKVVL